MIKSRHYIALIATILTIIPIILWFNAPLSQFNFVDSRATIASLGQMLGLAGTVLFALNLILSARLQIFDRYFNGLNQVYSKHSQIGQIAFMMLLSHPLLLLAKFATNMREAATFLWLSDNWAINWGIMALGLMIILLVLTLYLTPKYNIWKTTHKFMGLAFFLASLHIWLIPSDVSTYLPLRIYILFFAGLGLLAFISKTIFGKYMRKKYQYLVTDVHKINNWVTEIIMEAEDNELKFTPGQFVFLKFNDKSIGSEAHPFSISSAPRDHHLSFLVKNLGDYTEKIEHLMPGTVAEVEGPYGKFSFEKNGGQSQLWIAGGIGITPFISMAKSFSDNLDKKITLVYCVRNISEAVYLETLEKIADTHSDNFKVIPFYSDERGRLTTANLKEITGDLTKMEVLICAPPLMIQSLKQGLVLGGVKKTAIYSEDFSL